MSPLVVLGWAAVVAGLVLLTLLLVAAGYGVWHAIRTTEDRERQVGDFRRQLDTYGGGS